MIIHVFAVQDAAVGAFMQPFFSRSRGEAVRSFIDACGEEGKPFAKHRADYVLYSVGSFDDNSGRFTTEEPVRLMSGLEATSPDLVDDRRPGSR